MSAKTFTRLPSTTPFRITTTIPEAESEEMEETTEKRTTLTTKGTTMKPRKKAIVISENSEEVTFLLLRELPYLKIQSDEIETSTMEEIASTTEDENNEVIFEKKTKISESLDSWRNWMADFKHYKDNTTKDLD